MSNPHQSSSIPYQRTIIASVLLFSTAVAVRLAFWFYTRWTIEDAMIIARIVRNLVQHNELTFNLGQRISSATSPLFVLLVAIPATFGVDPVFSATAWGILASAFTSLVFFNLLCRYKPLMLSFLGSLVYVFFPTTVAYAVGGMETAFYTLLCILAIERFIHGNQSIALFIGALAALFRPDGLIVLVVILPIYLWQHRTDLKQAVVGLWPLLILPAGLFLHWAYYGVPLPQSFTAKGLTYQVDPLRNTLKYLDRMLFSQTGAVLFYILALFGLGWTFKRAPKLLIFAAWYLIYHLAFMLRAPLFSWYLQPPIFVLCLYAVLGLYYLVELTMSWLKQPRWVDRLQALAATTLSLLLIVSLLPYANGRIRSQAYVEQVPARVGDWLRSNTAPDDLVFTEALGYIGYHTHNRFVDWPGLATPNIPKLLAENPAQSSRFDQYLVIITYFKPTYLALRDNEWRSLQPQLAPDYQVCTELPSPTASDPSYIIASPNCAALDTLSR